MDVEMACATVYLADKGLEGGIVGQLLGLVTFVVLDPSGVYLVLYAFQHLPETAQICSLKIRNYVNNISAESCKARDALNKSLKTEIV